MFSYWWCVPILVGSDWVVVATPMSWVEVLAFTGLDVVTFALGSPATGVVVVVLVVPILVVSDWAVVATPMSWVEVLVFTGLDVVTLALGSPAA